MSLNKKQILELQEIGKLPLEKQKKKLEEFMKKLSPEQIEFLKRQQCLFCGIVDGRIKSKKIYEDESVIGILDINPANKGHALIFPKNHYGKLKEFDISHLFKVVNVLNGKVKEVVKAEGTNVFVAEGEVAGQRFDHVVVHVIPRFRDDGVVFSWEGRKVSEKELDGLSKEIKVEKIQEDKVEESEEAEQVEVDEDFRVP